MSHLKCLNFLKVTSNNVRTILCVPKKSLCNKKVDDLNVTIKLDQKKDEEKKSDTILFEQDEETGMVIITEREKDAAVKSRLSKEYNKLMISGKNMQVLTLKDGFKLTVNVGDSSSNDPPDKPLEKTIKELTKSKPKPPAKRETGLDKTIRKLKDTIVIPPSPPSKDPPTKRPTLVRQEAGEVIFAFIPREWFTFFFPVTGVTGFGTFLFTTGTFLISKEYYVLEHNYYSGLSMAIIVGAVIRYIGPDIAKYLDKEIQDFENMWKNYKKQNKDTIIKYIHDELFAEFQADGNLILVDAKRENVYLQRENEFRKRQVKVYDAVKRLLDYQASVGDVHRKIHHKNLVDYVTKEVKASLSPKMQEQLIHMSIDNLIRELNRTIKDDPDKKPPGSDDDPKSGSGNDCKCPR